MGRSRDARPARSTGSVRNSGAGWQTTQKKRPGSDDAHYHSHAVTRAARTRSNRANRDISSTVNRGTANDERGALRLTDWLGVSQARIRASYFPQKATCAVCRTQLTPLADAEPCTAFSLSSATNSGLKRKLRLVTIVNLRFGEELEVVSTEAAASRRSPRAGSSRIPARIARSERTADRARSGVKRLPELRSESATEQPPWEREREALDLDS
jgi:hypothetical protein